MTTKDFALGVVLGLLALAIILILGTQAPVTSSDPCAGATATNIPDDCRDIIEWEP